MMFRWKSPLCHRRYYCCVVALVDGEENEGKFTIRGKRRQIGEVEERREKLKLN